MVLPCPSRLLDRGSESIAPELLLERCRDVGASSARPGDLVDRSDEVGREQQVRAHVHAHTIAHGCAHTASAYHRPDDRPTAPTGMSSSSAWARSARRRPTGRRRGPATRVLGLERFELGHANGASADHSRIIRLSYHRPDYVRLAKRAYETWAEVEAEAGGDPIVTITGGLDLWPADPAIPKADYTESLTAEDVPFELLDAAEVRRRWPQWRLDDDVTAMWQAQGGLADPFKGNAAHRRLATRPRRDPARSHAGDGDPGRRRRRPTRSTPAGRRIADRPRHRHGRRLDQRPARVVRPAAAADRDQGAGDLLRGAGPRGLRARTGSRSGSGWTSRRSTASRRTARPGPKAAQDCRRPAGRPGHADIRSRRGRVRAAPRPSWRRHLPGAVGPPILTRDLPLHADPGSRLRGGSAAGRTRRRGRPRGGARLQVRIGAGPRSLVELRVDGSSPSDGELGAFRIDRPILLEADPATSWMV